MNGFSVSDVWWKHLPDGVCESDSCKQLWDLSFHLWDLVLVLLKYVGKFVRLDCGINYPIELVRTFY